MSFGIACPPPTIERRLMTRAVDPKNMSGGGRLPRVMETPGEPVGDLAFERRGRAAAGARRSMMHGGAWIGVSTTDVRIAEQASRLVRDRRSRHRRHTHHYFRHLNGVRTIASAVLAIVLWPLVLLGINLHIRR
jgi:hypothetical protein